MVNPPTHTTKTTPMLQVRDRTLGLKAQVLQNDAKIEKLLAMAVMGR